jgi:hypothetical protein
MAGVIPIKAWSYSRLNVFETCKLRSKLAVVDKIPEPPRPLPPGKTEHANDRGTRVHTAAELYVKGGVELVSELQWFAAEFEQLRELFKEGKVSLEGEWAFDRGWEPVAYMSSDVWVRIKCDIVVFLSETEAVVVDIKTGKRWGNEMKHAEQMRLYAATTFCKYPKLEKIRVELWYTDLDDIVEKDYTRLQGLTFLKNFEDRGHVMTTCEEFPPNPNAFSCKWCPYKPEALGGTGHCKVGV